MIWGYAKTNPLANFAPTTLDALITRTKSATQAISQDQSLLRSMLRHAPSFFALNTGVAPPLHAKFKPRAATSG